MIERTRPTIRPSVAVWVLASAFLAGCGTYAIPWRSAGVDPDAPWFGPNGRARTVYEVHTDLVVRKDEKMLWTHAGKQLSAETVAKDCEEYLQSHGVDRRPQELMADGSPRAPLAPGNYALAPRLRFPTTARIVCLDPVVVVLVPLQEDVDTLTHRDHWGITGTGYQGSTRFPFAQDAEWFSPTLGRGPESPSSSGPDTWISVPWGRLVLSHEGNEWVVTPRSASESRKSHEREAKSPPTVPFVKPDLRTRRDAQWTFLVLCTPDNTSRGGFLVALPDSPLSASYAISHSVYLNSAEDLFPALAELEIPRSGFHRECVTDASVDGLLRSLTPPEMAELPTRLPGNRTVFHAWTPEPWDVLDNAWFVTGLRIGEASCYLCYWQPAGSGMPDARLLREGIVVADLADAKALLDRNGLQIAPIVRGLGTWRRPAVYIDGLTPEELEQFAGKH